MTLLVCPALVFFPSECERIPSMPEMDCTFFFYDNNSFQINSDTFGLILQQPGDWLTFRRENTQCPLLDSGVPSFTNDEGQTERR